MTAVVTGGAGFLLAVLWFDLMFDIQVLRYRHRGTEAPEEVLASIAAYYRRVTTAARPMTWLVGAVMLATLVAIAVQVVGDDVQDGVAWASLLLAGSAIALAASHTFPSAARLGARADSPEVQSSLARSILRDHVLCIGAITALLATQLAFAV
jgi:di/tricarboxylate transporter